MDLVLMLLAVAVVSIGQLMVSSTYNKYSTITNSTHMTGREVALKILEEKGIDDVSVQEGTSAVLSDYYDPTNKIVRLSQKVYGENSISSIAVAAHEVGHAIQHHEGYSFIALRNKLLPYAQISSGMGWSVLIFGLMMSIKSLFYVGAIMIVIVGLFQLVTLPIELNASKRAKKELVTVGAIDSSEVSGVSSVLNAAAFTYIAAFLATVLQLLRIFLISRNRD